MAVIGLGWMHATAALTTLTTAFLASLVEFIEALTIVLAVGMVRGWRPALGGASAGAGLLIVTILLFGSALNRMPIEALRINIGTLLLLFGMRWLHKAVLRGAGIVPIHDEAVSYARATPDMGVEPVALVAGWDPVVVCTFIQPR